MSLPWDIKLPARFTASAVADMGTVGGGAPETFSMPPASEGDNAVFTAADAGTHAHVYIGRTTQRLEDIPGAVFVAPNCTALLDDRAVGRESFMVQTHPHPGGVIVVTGVKS